MSRASSPTHPHCIHLPSGEGMAYYWPVFEALFTHPLWAYRTGTFAFASDWPLWLLCVAIPAGIAVIAATLWRRRLLGWPRLLLLGFLQSALLTLVLCLIWRPVLNVE